MQIFIKDHDYDILKITSNGDFIPTLKKGNKVNAELRSKCNKGRAKRVANNYRDLSILFYRLDSK